MKDLDGRQWSRSRGGVREAVNQQAAGAIGAMLSFVLLVRMAALVKATMGFRHARHIVKERGTNDGV